MSTFKITVDQQGIERTLELSKRKFLFFPDVDVPHWGFYKEAIGLGHDYRDYNHRRHPREIYGSNGNANFHIMQVTGELVHPKNDPSSPLDINSVMCRSYFAVRCLSEDPLAFLTEEQKASFHENQKALLKTIERDIFSLPENASVSDYTKQITKLHVPDDNNRQLFSLCNHVNEIIERTSRHFSLDVPYKPFEGNELWDPKKLILRWIFQHPERDKIPATRGWLAVKAQEKMQEVMVLSKIDSMSLLWHEVARKLEDDINCTQTPGQIRALVSPLLGDATVEKIKDLLKDRRIENPSSPKVSIRLDNPNKMRDVCDARIEFLRETQGLQGSSFNGNPYPSNPRHAQERGFKSKRFGPK